MKSDRRSQAPAGWIAFPVLLACGASALAGWASDSLPIAAAVALPGGLAAAWWAERRLRLVIEPIAQIASGDRYAALPEHAGGGPIGEIARAAERMRQSLIDADALAVAHRSRESESKLHLAGHTFPGYTAVYTVALNLGIAIILTPVFNAMSARRAPLDATAAADYHA